MTIHQLSAGIDSLYWSAPSGIDTRRIDALKKARDAAAETGSPQPWRVFNGFALSIGSHGVGRYPAFLDCHEFRIQVTDSHHLPTVYVQLRAAFIHEVGFEARGAEPHGSRSNEQEQSHAAGTDRTRDRARTGPVHQRLSRRAPER